MPKSKENHFIRSFRLISIIELEQKKVRKALLKTKDNKEVILLLKRFDILTSRKYLIQKIKLNR